MKFDQKYICKMVQLTVFFQNQYLIHVRRASSVNILPVQITRVVFNTCNEK